MITPEIVISGVGLTEQTRRTSRSAVSLYLEAATTALHDAGISKEQVDGVAARWPGPGGTTFHPGSVDWTAQLGTDVSWVQDTYPQGIPAVLDAAAAIRAGHCSTVLIVGGQSGGLGTATGKVADYTRPDNEFVTPWGAFTAAHFALVANRAIATDPSLRPAMAQVAATIRNHGYDTPGAVMEGKGPYTAQDILDSPMVAEPFHLLDLCLATEGAAALVVTTGERAADHADQPQVAVAGGGMEWFRQQYVAPPREEKVRSVGRSAARRAFAQAGLGPEEIDVALLYDINSFEVLRQLELLGFCGPGESPAYVEDIGIGRDSSLPVNPHGGLMAFAHTGWGGPQLPIVEAVLQLRGTTGQRQIEGARTAIVTGAGSGAQYHNTMILRTDG